MFQWLWTVFSLGAPAKSLGCKVWKRYRAEWTLNAASFGDNQIFVLHRPLEFGVYTAVKPVLSDPLLTAFTYESLGNHFPWLLKTGSVLKRSCLLRGCGSARFQRCQWRGYSGFQVTRMIEWGQTSKPKKISGPKFDLKKIPCRASLP